MTFQPKPKTPESANEHRRIELTPASAILSERVRWLWRPRLPLRSLSVIAGEKGLGKSILTNARLVAEATRGDLEGELRGRPIDVLVCTAEDDWRSVVKPRLMAHGADLDRVHRVAIQEGDAEEILTLPDDVALVEAQVERLRADGHPVGMLVIDPIGAFLSGATDTHRDASVRRALAPLAAFANRCDLVVLVVAHLNKTESTRLINRVSGAGAFVNAARSVLILARSPDDAEGERGGERVLVQVGSNWGRYAPSLAMTVGGREVKLEDGSLVEVGYLEITGECDIGIEDLQSRPDERGGTDAEEAIAAALIDGPRPSRQVKTQVAGELGCSPKTVERAAMRMEERGELLTACDGWPRTTTWTLLSTSVAPFHSRDTQDGPVGTVPNFRRVPTVVSPVPTEDPTHSRDSGDSKEGRVPTVSPESGQSPAQTTQTGDVDESDVERFEAIAERHPGPLSDPDRPAAPEGLPARSDAPRALTGGGAVPVEARGATGGVREHPLGEAAQERGVGGAVRPAEARPVGGILAAGDGALVGLGDYAADDSSGLGGEERTSDPHADALVALLISEFDAVEIEEPTG
jgi:putative DNA primase/helicase